MFRSSHSLIDVLYMNEIIIAVTSKLFYKGNLLQHLQKIYSFVFKCRRAHSMRKNFETLLNFLTASYLKYIIFSAWLMICKIYERHNNPAVYQKLSLQLVANRDQHGHVK